MNFVNVFWLFLSACFFVAFCAHKLAQRLPRRHLTGRAHLAFQDLIRYGKTKQRVQRDVRVRALEIPKRWFWHFYAISVLWNGLLLALYLSFTFQQRALPSWLTGLIDIVADAPAGQVPQLSTLLVLVLLCGHSARRLLECLLVSVYSDGVLHFMQYAFGVFYYVALGLTVLTADRLGDGTGPLRSQLAWFHGAGALLFLGASVMQHQATVQLAGLRKGKTGAVETLAHVLPRGGWFELVSCPHYLAELLIYVGLSLAVGGLSLTWWLVVLYVLFNQGLAAQLCHDLYASKYEAYPRHRKAFIPFVL
ncbi:polyprenol reductase [Pseudoliparis swirei]|uniref:polyprenol reductase n=1 Tax=Pseudoliparis swirei TaxID=2059687 RepID=UPI0024BE9DC1|nr:polyprenol reductase [Pseudoliparis swirei]